MKKFVMTVAATAAIFASPVFAHEKVVPYCDHFEIVSWDLETEHGMKKVSGEAGDKEVFEDHNGAKWVVTYNDEEACLTKGKQK